MSNLDWIQWYVILIIFIQLGVGYFVDGLPKTNPRQCFKESFVSFFAFRSCLAEDFWVGMKTDSPIVKLKRALHDACDLPTREARWEAILIYLNKSIREQSVAAAIRRDKDSVFQSDYLETRNKQRDTDMYHQLADWMQEQKTGRFEDEEHPGETYGRRYLRVWTLK